VVMLLLYFIFFFFFSSRRRHTRSDRDWSSDVCSSDLLDTSYDWHQVFDIQATLGTSTAIAYASQSYVIGFTESLSPDIAQVVYRSEERRVGKECRSRRSPDQ